MADEPGAPQMGLFGEDAAPLALAHPRAEQLAPALPQILRMGTSSWSFSGWKDLLYRGSHRPALLSRQGLGAYAAHPLLRTVSIDRGFYAPVGQSDYALYASQVPPSFRFVVKAWRQLTAPVLDGRPNPDFLNAELARDAVIDPACAGLGPTLDRILFQFSPMHLGQIQGATGFADRLAEFLTQLPSDARYAVEVRNPELLGPDLRAALDASQSIYTLNLLPAMPDIDTQFRQMQLVDQQDYLVRWLLTPGLGYQEAKERFAPFNRVQAPQASTRARLVSFIQWAHRQGRHFTLQVNNKAEGCAPLSIMALAELLAAPPTTDT